MTKSKDIQKEAAEALLDRGVSLPLKEIRLPMKKKPLIFRVTMRRPYLSGQMCIGRIYLKLGITFEEMKTFSKEEEMKFISEHGKDLSRIIALTICRSPLSRSLFLGAMAWFIRNCVEYKYQVAAAKQFVSLMGTAPFMNIIRSAEMTNPMRLRLSQKKKGS